MKHILDAVANGRLFEIGNACKDEALLILAQRLGCNPKVMQGRDLVTEIELREREFNTGIGLGVAVPHLRASCEDGPVYCVLGWSAQGIDYGALDGVPVHLIAMYYIPDAQKNAYLKEIAALIKVFMQDGVACRLAKILDLETMRSFLGELGGASTDRS